MVIHLKRKLYEKIIAVLVNINHENYMGSTHELIEKFMYVSREIQLLCKHQMSVANDAYGVIRV